MKFAFVAAAIAGLALSATAQGVSVDQANAQHQQAMATGTTEDRVAAASSLARAIMASADRSDAVLRAYESGQTLCVYNGCKGAEAVSSLAVSRPVPDNVLTTADVQLLQAYADWMTSGGADSRRALDIALDNYAGTRATPLSVTAFQTRYTEDFNEGDWPVAAQTAAAAVRHFLPNRAIIGERWSDAVIAATTSEFNYKPSPATALRLARHSVELVELDESLPERPHWMQDHAYTTLAWQHAMSAYFSSGGGYRQYGNSYASGGPSEEELMKQVGAIHSEAGPSDLIPRLGPIGDASQLPFCEGSLNAKPEFRFPANAARAGTFGAVVMRLSIDQLDVKDVEVLAAVPSDVFEKNVERGVRKWKWVVDEEKASEPCSTSHPDVIQAIWFLIH